MKKILTVVLDGFGIREEKHGNAIAQAETKNFDNLLEKYPNCTLHASEEWVGLPKGQFGNSEVGHMTIGAGRKIQQEATIISDTFENDGFINNPKFMEMIDLVKNENKKLHIMGLTSSGGIHSNIEHLKSLLKLLNKLEIKDISIHSITDGRDTDYKSSYKFIKEIEELNIGYIATVCGRVYAMDRDNKWDRTKKYYNAITKGIGITAHNLEKTINAVYDKGIYDEYMVPIIVNKDGLIKDGDVLFWFNYRDDRAIQILSTLLNPNFNNFNRDIVPKLKAYTFYPIENTENITSILEERKLENTFGDYLSQLELTQARIAETEKYAHVTFFFDGGVEKKLKGCDRFLVPSPNVASYDLKPEMSAIDITKKAMACLEKDYDFILVNYANADMVGHTGDMDAAIKACMAVDICLGKLLEVAEDNFYTVIVMSDHGNADIMFDDKNNVVTTHTTSKVPFIITDKKLRLKDGDLTNVAPTILEYMDIAIPKDMTDKTLIVGD